MVQMGICTYICHLHVFCIFLQDSDESHIFLSTRTVPDQHLYQGSELLIFPFSATFFHLQVQATTTYESALRRGINIHGAQNKHPPYRSDRFRIDHICPSSVLLICHNISGQMSPSLYNHPGGVWIGHGSSYVRISSMPDSNRHMLV